MRRLQLTDPAPVRALLRDEVTRSPEAAFLHRLHCVALVAAGHACGAVAAAFGDDDRSVQRWVHRFQEAGAAGLAEAPRRGRPARLGEAEYSALREALARPPSTFGHAATAWSAETLRREVARRYGIAFTRRHCVRLLGRLARPEAASGAGAAPDNPTAFMSR